MDVESFFELLGVRPDRPSTAWSSDESFNLALRQEKGKLGVACDCSMVAG